MEYKRVKVSLPYCPQCKQVIQGNGSIIMPYKCECGFWRYNTETDEYFIEPKCACMDYKGEKDKRFTKHTQYNCSNTELGISVG